MKPGDRYRSRGGWTLVEIVVATEKQVWARVVVSSDGLAQPGQTIKWTRRGFESGYKPDGPPS